MIRTDSPALVVFAIRMQFDIVPELYPLVNIQKTMDNHIFFIGKSTLNGPCSIAMVNHQRVSIWWVVSNSLLSDGMLTPNL